MKAPGRVFVFVLAVISPVAGGRLLFSAAEAAGSLLIESEPAGATVYINGRLAGETPLTLPAIAVGVHRVRLVRLGFLENSRLVTVRAGTRGMLRMQLTDPAPQAPQRAALKIVVIDGEGAVNIIQQKTAVAPVVEVRDRNDQPVAGAVVSFTIRNGRASFNGARMLSLSTDAAGRATATGLTPIGNGAVRIGASAMFQGQTAAVTIAQTNVLTAAEASVAASSGTGAAGAGTGLSHTAIAGIVGGAGAGIAGAVVVSKKAARLDRTFRGQYSGRTSLTFTTSLSTGGTAVCVHTYDHNGTLGMTVQEESGGALTGTAEIATVDTVVAVSSGCTVNTVGGRRIDSWRLPLTGTTSSPMFSGQHSYTEVPLGGGRVDGTRMLTFSGSRANEDISGNLTIVDRADGVTGQGQPLVWSGLTTASVTIR